MTSFILYFLFFIIIFFFLPAQYAGAVRFYPYNVWADPSKTRSKNLRFESWRTQWDSNIADYGGTAVHLEAEYSMPEALMDQETDGKPHSFAVIVDSTFNDNVGPLNLEYEFQTHAAIWIEGRWQTEVHGSKFINNKGSCGKICGQTEKYGTNAGDTSCRKNSCRKKTMPPEPVQKGGALTLRLGGPHNISSTLFERNSNSVGGGLAVFDGAFWPIYVSDSTFLNNRKSIYCKFLFLVWLLLRLLLVL